MQWSKTIQLFNFDPSPLITILHYHTLMINQKNAISTLAFSVKPVSPNGCFHLM